MILFSVLMWQHVQSVRLQEKERSSPTGTFLGNFPPLCTVFQGVAL